MNQADTHTTPEFGVTDLNAQKEFSDRRQVRKALFKNAQLISEIVCYEPGQASIAHQHPRQNELFFVLDGCVNMEIGGTEHALPAGSFLSVEHGAMHDVRNLTNERSVIVFVKIMADLAPTPRDIQTAPESGMTAADAAASGTPEFGVTDLNAQKEFSDRRQVRKALFKNAQLISEIVCYEPGQASIAHQHPRQNELFFVIDGRVNMNVGGTEHALPAGSFLSVEHGVMHDVRNLTSERSVIVFVKIAADLAPSERLAAPSRGASKTAERIAVDTIDVRVHSIAMEAENVHSFELRAAGPTPLPPFTAGAHVEVHMAEHLTRSYSLANDPGEAGRYVIAVNREDAGRGGSRFMHSAVRVGQVLRISPPRNNFELRENAAHTVFIAGGIGITPILSMMARLERIGKPWTLHYCGRNRQLMAYLDLLEAKKRRWADVHLHVDSESGGKFLDMARVVTQAPAESHFYCCGPKPMLQAFEAATSGLSEQRVHVEYFSAKEEAALQGGFVVELARSRKTLNVQPGKSILDTLLNADVFVDFSCKQGICGSCQVPVLEGVPDHRDSVLSAKEHERNDRMMVCCSGARSPRLVLDL